MMCRMRPNWKAFWRRALTGAALLIVLVPAGAGADTLIQSAPGTRNLTQGGGWLAWIEPTGNRWRIVTRSPIGVLARPEIPDFASATNPSIGSSGFAVRGKRVLAVYSRCRGVSPVDRCDLWALDLAAGTERRLSAASSPTCSETSPSIYAGGLAFVRTGEKCPSTGVFRQRGASAPRRVTSVLARETAVNGSRVAYVHDLGDGFGVTVRRLSGDGRAIVLARDIPRLPRSLVYGRYTLAWLETVDEGVALIASRRISGSRLKGLPLRRGRRILPASTDSIGAEDGTPRRLLDGTGVKTIAPPLL